MPPPEPESAREHSKDIPPWIPLSMLAFSTAALALPLALLRRRQRASSSALSKRTYPSQLTSAPPVRRASPRRVLAAPPPPTSTIGTPSTKSGSFLRGPSDAPLRESKEDAFNAALYSFKAFGIATALVVAGGTASVWGVKTYLGVKDTQEFASAMRLTLVNKWPLLTSRIYRAADSTRLSPPDSSSSMTPPTVSKQQNDPTSRTAAHDGWNWPDAQARLTAAYERGGLARFAEAAVGELEAELELERHKRELGNSTKS
ncbi:hypothetical protein BC826DRAFT_1025884 [Russula brevipes]|nr:hypothetical protein BC826DRAFT_1025884 [Russula brevipes]